jgi:hypothetical protein
MASSGDIASTVTAGARTLCVEVEALVERGVDRRTWSWRWGGAVAVGVLALVGCAGAGGSDAGSGAASRRAVASSAGSDAGEVVIVPPEAFDGPAVVPTGPPPSLAPVAASSGANQLWAVVIGISDYPGQSHDLPFARNDADDMEAVLRRAGQPASQRVTLTDGHASAGTIRSALDWLVAHAGPSSTAVVFYAGHVRKLASTTEALLAADTQVVTDAEVAQRLAPLRAGRSWIVIAGCYGGGFTEVVAPGRILTGAAPANSLAYETATYHRSYLGEYLVHRGMLQGRGGPTVQSAFDYAATELRRDHPGRVPVQFDGGGGPLSLTGGAVLAAPAQSPPPPPPSGGTTASGPPPPTTTTSAPPPTDDGQGCLLTAGSLVRCPSRRED